MEVLDYFVFITLPILVILIGILIAHLYELSKLGKLEDIKDDLGDLKKQFNDSIRAELAGLRTGLVELAKQPRKGNPHPLDFTRKPPNESKKQENT